MSTTCFLLLYPPGPTLSLCVFLNIFPQTSFFFQTTIPGPRRGGEFEVPRSVPSPLDLVWIDIPTKRRSVVDNANRRRLVVQTDVLGKLGSSGTKWVISPILILLNQVYWGDILPIDHWSKPFTNTSRKTIQVVRFWRCARVSARVGEDCFLLEAGKIPGRWWNMKWLEAKNINLPVVI